MPLARRKTYVRRAQCGKYMAKKCDPSSQGWGTFLRNHAPHIAAMGQRADVSHSRPSRSRMRSRMAIPDLPRPSLGYRPVTDAYNPHPAREDISPTHRHCRAPGSTGLDRQGAPDGGASTRGQGELIETANRHIQKNPRPTLDYSCGNCGRSAYSGPPRPRRLAGNPGAVLRGELLSSSVRPASRVSKRAGPGSGLSLNFVDLVE
jgi:hypothetical protein